MARSDSMLCRCPVGLMLLLLNCCLLATTTTTTGYLTEAPEKELDGETLFGLQPSPLTDKSFPDSLTDNIQADVSEEATEVTTTTTGRPHHHHRHRYGVRRPEQSRAPPLAANASHAYMKLIYEEIEGQIHVKWSAMSAVGRTVRGMEPFAVSSDRHSSATILEFDVSTVLRNHLIIQQLDLVLSLPGHRSALESLIRDGTDTDCGTYQVVLLDEDHHHHSSARPYQSTDIRSGSLVTALCRRSTDGDRFAVLELQPFLDTWFRAFLSGRESFGQRHLLRLRLMADGLASGSDPASQRPLLVAYYVTGEDDKDKDNPLSTERVHRALRSAQHNSRGRRSPHSKIHQQPRPCTVGRRCMSVERLLKFPPSTPEPSSDGHPHVHGEEACVLHDFDVSLDQLQWESWVIAPPIIKMNYCEGQCKAPLVETHFNSTYNAVVRSILLASEGKTDIPPPHCVPTRLRPTNIFYVETVENKRQHSDSKKFYLEKLNQIVIKGLENFVAEQCGCR